MTYEQLLTTEVIKAKIAHLEKMQDIYETNGNEEKSLSCMYRIRAYNDCLKLLTDSRHLMFKADEYGLLPID